VSVEHIARLEGVVKAKLKAIALGQVHGYAVSPGTVPQADEQGNIIGIGPGWSVIVSIPHPRPLLGQPRSDIASSFPLPGILPPDQHFEAVAERLFQNCMEEKDKANAKPAAVGMDLGAIQT
jgi:hypothetical protein